MPFLFAGLLVALVLAAAVPGKREESTVELVDHRERKKERATAVTALSIFFWVLIGVLVAVILVRYLSGPR